MKIGFISDIHIDVNKEYNILEEISEHIREENIDVVVIAGDISEDAETTIEAMGNLEKSSHASIYYVPGNHDLWSDNLALLPTGTIYEKYKNDPRCLVDNPILLKGEKETFALIGDIGWYDYSFGSEQFNLSDFERMNYKNRTFNDAIKNSWTTNNRGQSDYFLDKLERQMEKYKDLPMILVTHMLPIEEFTVPKEQKNWNYFNAYLGTNKLQKLYKKYPVKYAVCGHVHYRKEIEKEGIHYYCACLNYHNEWFSTIKNSKQQIRESFACIEI